MKKVLILLLVLLAAFSILSAVELQLKEIEGISIAPQNNRGEVEVDYCGTFNGKIIGTNEAGTLYAAARFTPTELANYVGDSFQQIKFIVINTATDVTVRIFEGATAFTVGQMLYEGHVEDLVTVDWCTHELASSVAIEEGKDYWIVYEVTCTGGYPLAADDGPAIAGKGDLISMDGIAWESIKTEYNLNQNFMVTAVVQNNPAENDMNALGIIGLSGNVEADKALIPE
ncbi:MAG: hypothetical protein KAS49_04065, partial [Candidatus Cloacimonetes bacterium]|nr:hypothetical protein [Candidatus Cloacimonadota bacterium]